MFISSHLQKFRLHTEVCFLMDQYVLQHSARYPEHTINKKSLYRPIYYLKNSPM
uniref:Uncharacterized protein n=1 Tax=Rhizophora mucronata TaxID=61149 RepID=A0A2P2Q1H7_RHIMU